MSVKILDQLKSINIKTDNVLYNLSHAELVEEVIKNNEGVFSESGAIACNTGKFTGRSPKDKFIVKDGDSEKNVWWGDVNHPLSTEHFENIYSKMKEFLLEKKIYVRDVMAGADIKNNLKIRVINTLAYHNLFCLNMFISPEKNINDDFLPEFTIICIPEFEGKPLENGLRQGNFTIINFTQKIILIGGSAYTGEIKKGIFSVLHYILPLKKDVLSLHSSANIGKKDNDTALFFGLSGTGKTTLSTDPNRLLIGDDEHGWGKDGVFNFEGGCYAKVIGLSDEDEPEIFEAIRFGALLENVVFFQGTRKVNYDDKSITENTRVSYPIEYIPNSVKPSIGGIPKNIFFLTADAFGVLPPISKLTIGQAMYHFISGYTAKLAGTEMGVTEPQTTFSACFGQAFLSLHPTIYAEMLGKKIKEYKVNVWLVNTGWSGGSYGKGQRMKLKLTRSLITAALENKFESIKFNSHDVFNILVPESCPEVPSEMLDPKNTWENKEEYDDIANKLAKAFVENFNNFKDFANEEILAGAPKTI